MSKYLKISQQADTSKIFSYSQLKRSTAHFYRKVIYWLDETMLHEILREVSPGGAFSRIWGDSQEAEKQGRVPGRRWRWVAHTVKEV